MARSVYNGKRGANAGDEFHELWALRRGLETISRRSSVQYITVEGIAAAEGVDPEGPEWDGVDCAIYLGLEGEAIDRIELVQAKYSPSAPKAPWTLARFVSSQPGKARNSSVAARLAEAYTGTCRDHPELAANGRITVKLVSNQPASAELADLNARGGDLAHRDAIAKATGLGEAALADFLEALDFSECGSIGRKGIEEHFIKDIAAWDDVDTASHVFQFREFIRNRMRPEGRRLIVDAESILSIFNSGNLRAIFPCPPAFERVEGLIGRAVSEEIIAAWADGQQRICLHGQGGEGKTTVLADIAERLPENSLIVAFDCYGGGSYLNSNSYRHKPQDAFVQLANDCSTALLLPLLLTQNRDADHPRLFMDRLKRTAGELAKKDAAALLIVAVDAADNSVAAAEDAADGVPSFVAAFLKLGDPPANVRFLVSARSGRLDKLVLPASYVPKQIGPFTKEEAELYLNSALGDCSTDWHAEVLKLTGGNPRVLKYALDYADGDASLFLAYLAPHGKDLSAIFVGILEGAFKKAGSEADVRQLCAALALLPRPIPIATLAAVTGHGADHVRDILSDLRPGILLDEDRASFRDEDFEHFVRETGGAVSSDMLERAADHFIGGADTDAYLAEHASNILVRAGRNAALIALARQAVADYPVKDPAVRTAIHEARMRAALRICRASGDNEAAVKLLLAGADAFRRDAEIRALLFDNIDLSAHFSREQMRRIFLGDPDERPRHGKFLMHAIAAGARGDDPARIAHERRLLSAWFASHSDVMEQRRNGERHDDAWDLDADDLAAYAVGRMEIEGAEKGLAFILGARPGHFRTAILRAAFDRLARSGEYARIAELAALLPRSYPWIGLVQIFLALGGCAFDRTLLLKGLEQIASRVPRLLGPASDFHGPTGERQDLLELIITGAEIALMHGAAKARLKPLLKALSPDDFRTPARMNTYATPANNVAIRAAVLLRAVDDKSARPEDIIVLPKIAGRSREVQKKRRDQVADCEKAKKATAALLSAFKVRADALLGKVAPGKALKEIEKVAAALRGPAYSSDDHGEQRGRQHYFARSLLLLAARRGVKAAQLFEKAIAIERGRFSDSEESSELLRHAQYIPALAVHVPEKVEAICANVRHRKIAGRDKIDLITRHCRIALYQSAPVANAVFNLAVEVASEIDAESVQALMVCQSLARRGRPELRPEAAHRLARSLAAIAKDVGERVGSQDNFPWDEIMAALARLDLPLALAATARFDEIGLERILTLLDPVLIEALDAGTMSAGAAAALAALAGAPAGDLVGALAAHGLDENRQAAEYLAQHLIWRRPAGAAKMLLLLGPVTASQQGPWMAALCEAAAFSTTLPEPERPRYADAGERRKAADNLRFDWSSIRSPDDLVAAVDAAKETIPKEQYLLPSDLLNRAVDQAPVHRRVDALTYASSHSSRFGYTYHIGEFLRQRLEDWAGDPAVAQWRRDNLLAAITADLDKLVRYIEMGQSPLRRLLELSGARDDAIVDCLLAGVEARIDELGAGQIYLLAGEIARHVPAAAAAAALEEHIERRLARLAFEDQHLDALDELPSEGAKAAARFIFAMLGSASAPRRWEAAHAARRIAGAREKDILDHLVACYTRTGEQCFGHPAAPFGILNAKLWLMIALARAAHETPVAIEPHRRFLFEVAESVEFPHVLIRAFAQQALEGLAKAFPDTFSADDRARIAAVNTSPLPPARRPKDAPYTIFERTGLYKKGRRFDFDTMDTIPYVYEDAVRGFAEPTEEAFLDRAEHWIVDVWKAPAEPYRVDKLRSGGHYGERDGLSGSTSHGALPSFERYQTYLEYHAMYCAVGDLLRTHALRVDPDDDWGRFDLWLARRGLTTAPMWLSDLRGPAPLEEQFWQSPQDKRTWLETRRKDEVEAELLLGDPDWIVLAADHWAYEEALSSVVSIETCLVAGDTASALRHAVEAQPTSYAYRLAVRRDDEIHEGAFQLKSLLRDIEADRGIDTHDWFRGELNNPSILPRDWVIGQLGLSPATSGGPGWIDAEGRDAIRVIGWSDEAEHGGRERFDYRVHGSRLAFRRDLVAKLLDETGLDIALEVKMQRSLGNRYGRRSRDDEEKTEYDRLIILRRDGRLENSGEPLGYWLADRNGAECRH